MESPASPLKNSELCETEAQVMTLPKTNLLKIDKDLIVEKHWLKGYVDIIIQTCKTRGVNVTQIKMSLSESKGFHLYILINPEIEAEEANYLQFLLGDDSLRVGFNRARIESDLNEFNKLFEKPNARLRTIYHNPRFLSTKKPLR